jgi:PTH1 family peptidyl-tRNA hydrolase
MKIIKANSNINLIVALGNIGKDYSNTRHNSGFIFADTLIKALIKNGLENTKEKTKDAVITVFPSLNLRVLMPTTMMNNSGRAVANFMKMHMDQSLLLVHDDLDLKLGEYKIQKGKSPKKHNGVASVEHAIGSLDFW